MFEVEGGLLYPDTMVGTDSHSTMVNGLGIVGWGVGGIEALSVMLGQPIVMVLPAVVGVELAGFLQRGVTATDLVLEIVQTLRKEGVVGKFVEFFGEGVQCLSLADRATVANMAPEYGATMGFFPVDSTTLSYYRSTGRPASSVDLAGQYLRANSLFNTRESWKDIRYSETLRLDLSAVQPCVSGPKRPHDRILLKDLKTDFEMYWPGGAPDLTSFMARIRACVALFWADCFPLLAGAWQRLTTASRGLDEETSAPRGRSKPNAPTTCLMDRLSWHPLQVARTPRIQR